MLVVVLTDVFDPPPEGLAIPGVNPDVLAVAAAVAAAAAAVLGIVWTLRSPAVELLRSR